MSSFVFLINQRHYLVIKCILWPADKINDPECSSVQHSMCLPLGCRCESVQALPLGGRRCGLCWLFTSSATGGGILIGGIKLCTK